MQKILVELARINDGYITTNSLRIKPCQFALNSDIPARNVKFIAVMDFMSSSMAQKRC